MAVEALAEYEGMELKRSGGTYPCFASETLSQVLAALEGTK